jgi:hypothetical protein
LDLGLALVLDRPRQFLCTTNGEMRCEQTYTGEMDAALRDRLEDGWE